MDRGRAETHLRLLAEAELRRATAPGALGRGYPGRLSLVAQALIAVGAVDVGTADEIQAELHFALAARLTSAGVAPQQLAGLIGVRPPRALTETFTVPRQASWRVVPAGQVIRIRDGEIHGELGLLAYLQTTHGGRFTMAGRMHGPASGPGIQPARPGLPVSRQFTAADDKGDSYTLRFSFRTGLTGSAALAGVLDLRPDPRHEIRWLDLRTAPGEPATRIRLDPRDPQIPAPQFTMTRKAAPPVSSCWTSSPPGSSPARGPSRRTTPGSWPAPRANCARLSATGPAHCRRAAGSRRAAPVEPGPGPARRVVRPPGHHRPRHHHTARRRPAGTVASMLTRYHRRKPYVTPAPGSWAATAAELPELDGARVAVLGLHQADRGTILHLHAGGVTMEDDWEYYRAVRPLPALWIRDQAAGTPRALRPEAAGRQQ